ncbi:MAG: hypothetical protein WA151_08075 [Desulfatirhabdiaceae bacterium]
MAGMSISSRSVAPSRVSGICPIMEPVCNQSGFSVYDIFFQIKIPGALSVGDDRQFFKASAAMGLSPPCCLPKIII